MPVTLAHACVCGVVWVWVWVCLGGGVAVGWSERYESMFLSRLSLMLRCTRRFLVQNRKFKAWAVKLCRMGLVQRHLMPNFDAVAHTTHTTHTTHTHTLNTHTHTQHPHCTAVRC